MKGRSYYLKLKNAFGNIFIKKFGGITNGK